MGSETTVVFDGEQERDYRGNPVRRCIACRRVRWNGGHAISDRECVKTGDDTCRRVVAEAATAAALARATEAEGALERIDRLTHDRSDEADRLLMVICDVASAALRALRGKEPG